MTPSLSTTQNQIMVSLIDAANRKRPSGCDFEPEVYSWPQRWPNTSCGFGGISGQAFTTAQTVAVVWEYVCAFIYHAGKFAYVMDMSDREKISDFMDYLVGQNMPGLVEWEKMQS